MRFHAVCLIGNGNTVDAVNNFDSKKNDAAWQVADREREIGAILALHGEGKRNKKIAAAIGRSGKAVHTLLSKKEGPARTKKVGRRMLLRKRTIRCIFRLACVKQISSRNITATLDHVVKRSTVLRVLRASKFAKYIRRKPTPHPKKHHKAKRLAFAKKHLNKSGFWERVMFTDEKKFNVDGPDDCQHYRHDIRKDPETYSNRVVGSGSVMVWADVCLNSKTDIAFLEGKQTAAKYTQTLNGYFNLGMTGESRTKKIKLFDPKL